MREAGSGLEEVVLRRLTRSLADDWFELQDDSPYMLLVADVLRPAAPLHDKRRARAIRARTQRAPGTFMRWAAVIFTFHVVTLAWILFRAPDLQTSWRVLSGVVVAPLGDPTIFLSRNGYSLVLLALFLLSHRFDTHARLQLLVMRARRSLLWPAVALTWATAVALDAGSSAKFIYFDF